MEATAGQVLKANNVNVQGRFRLELDPTASAPVASPAASAASVPPAAASTPGVRIVETCNEYAVMEVTCGCGQKHLVRCDFQPPAA